MGIITLTTDLGLRDYYVASLKGKILSACPDALIVDISHDIQAFNIVKAAFYLRSCYKDFPDGTIHVMGVSSEPVIATEKNPQAHNPSILKFHNQFFIGNDNGFFSLLLGENEPQGFWHIEDVFSNLEHLKDTTKNILLEAALKIYKGIDIHEFATESESFLKLIPVAPTLSNNRISGLIHHIDKYGNIITTISKKLFYQQGTNIPFNLVIGRNDYNVIGKISKTYGDVEVGGLVAFFNSDDLLEVAINKGATNSGGGVADIFGYKEGDTIRITFEPKGSAKDFGELEFH